MSPMLILATKRSRRRGFILAVTFFFVMLTSIGALLLTRTLMDQQRLNQRRRDHQTAFYAAEAGVAQVLHWGNFPAEYTPNITLFYRNPSTGAFPSLAGLIVVMPITSLIVLIWLHTDNPGDSTLITNYIKGVLWGLLPSFFFYLTAIYCFKRHLPLAMALSAGFGVWLVSALLFHWLLL